MLVLTRKVGETIRIGEDVTITVLHSRSGRVKIGIDAPREVPIIRDEVTRDEITRDEQRPVDRTTSEAVVRPLQRRLARA